VIQLALNPALSDYRRILSSVLLRDPEPCFGLTITLLVVHRVTNYKLGDAWDIVIHVLCPGAMQDELHLTYVIMVSWEQ